MEQEPPTRPPAPRPERRRVREGGRSDRVRRTVGEAVLSLLAEGRWQFSMVEVAERADVNRRTLYRWWPTTTDLVAEALDQHVLRVPVPTSGDWEVDVRDFAHALAAFAADPLELATGALLATRSHPELADVVTARYQPALDAWRQMASLASARGDLNPDLDPDTVVTTLVAPLLLTPLMSGRPLPPDAVDRVVDVILAATRPR